MTRALDALGDLPEGFDLPGLAALSSALIAIADELDPDIEPEDDCDGEEERLPLFAFAARAGPP